MPHKKATRKPRAAPVDPAARERLAVGFARGIADAAVRGVARYLECNEPAARRMLAASLAKLEEHDLPL